MVDASTSIGGSKNPFARVWRFWARRRADKDREIVELLSKPGELEAVHAAKISLEMTKAKTTSEGRGLGSY